MLRYTIRTYLGETFRNGTYWLIFGVLLLSEYLASTQFRGPLAFVELLQFIAIPLYIFLVSTVFFTEDRVLTFELVMFRSWSAVAFGRLVSLLLALTPFMAFTFLVAHFHSVPVSPVLAGTLFYGAAVLLSTVIGGGSRLYVLSMGLLFMLPLSSLVLIQNQASLGNPLHGFMGYLAYLFAPVYGSHAVSSGALLVNRGRALAATLLLSVFMWAAYVPAFKRRELRPAD